MNDEERKMTRKRLNTILDVESRGATLLKEFRRITDEEPAEGGSAMKTPYTPGQELICRAQVAMAQILFDMVRTAELMDIEDAELVVRWIERAKEALREADQQVADTSTVN